MGAAPSAPAIPPEDHHPAPLDASPPPPPSAVPVVFTWSGRAHHVYVTGSWDDWDAKDVLTRAPGSGEYSAVLSLPVGLYQYKFVVDGNWQHNPSLPTTTDAHGNLNNIADVKPHVPEYDVEVSEETAPPSPKESYDFSFISPEASLGEPPTAPFSLGVVETTDHHLNFTRHDHLLVDNVPMGSVSDIRSMMVMERYKDRVIHTTYIIPRAVPQSLAAAAAVAQVAPEAFQPLQAHFG